ncbi:MAG: hypothetical protein LBQ63_08245 [Deltaproteobacteria bacterium]|nr:hypothetical protein [Deltaproteobacteria bacterium]
MRFITSAYGNDYAALLAVFLKSLHAYCPELPVTVYWQDMDDDIMAALRAVFPRVACVKTEFSIAGSPHQKISSKMKLWLRAVEEARDETLCLIDSDTVVQRPLKGFLNGYDCIFTDKEEQFHLNTGVVILRNTPSSSEFLQAWTEKTLSIVNDAALLEQAVSVENHYGAADQMALYTLIDYHPERKEYAYSAKGGKFTLKAVPCTVLNQTNSVPLSPDIYVYHYKGGWRGVLLKGIHSPYRTKKACLPMQIQYLRLYRDVLNSLRREATSQESINKIRLHVPSYFDLDSGAFLPWRFRLELAKDTLKKWIGA